jgi:hypothetical protein
MYSRPSGPIAVTGGSESTQSCDRVASFNNSALYA